MMQRAGGNSYATPLRSAREIYEKLIEQGHQRAKRRIPSLLGFKPGAAASITLDGIELIQKMRKQRSCLRLRNTTLNQTPVQGSCNKVTPRVKTGFVLPRLIIGYRST
jgi:hypothetical protein